LFTPPAESSHRVEDAQNYLGQLSISAESLGKLKASIEATQEEANQLKATIALALEEQQAARELRLRERSGVVDAYLGDLRSRLRQLKEERKELDTALFVLKAGHVHMEMLLAR
jgi:hypothetical protein